MPRLAPARACLKHLISPPGHTFVDAAVKEDGCCEPWPASQWANGGARQGLEEKSFCKYYGNERGGAGSEGQRLATRHEREESKKFRRHYRYCTKYECSVGSSHACMYCLRSSTPYGAMYIPQQPHSLVRQRRALQEPGGSRPIQSHPVAAQPSVRNPQRRGCLQETRTHVLARAQSFEWVPVTTSWSPVTTSWWCWWWERRDCAMESYA